MRNEGGTNINVFRKAVAAAGDNSKDLRLTVIAEGACKQTQ